MSNTPTAENDVPVDEQRQSDEEASWFDRLLQKFGLGEEPDLRELIEDALELQAAGCFSIVLEAVPAAVARAATRALAVPTIGIGAGGDTDGQVLVWHDMLGYYEGHAPRFVKRYAELGDAIVDALGRYADEVRSGAFPEAQHTYSMPEEERAAFEEVSDSQRAR